MDMEAGRELDALVAEKVMGETVENGKVKWRYVRDGKGCYLWADPEEYSTSIADAWLVVEHMRADGWHLQLFSDKGWAASFHRNGAIPIYEGGDTAEGAICLAALKAVTP